MSGKEVETSRMEKEYSGEGYSSDWWHCVIHLNPKTGEMHSDGDHRVRHWIQEQFKRIGK